MNTPEIANQEAQESIEPDGTFPILIVVERCDKCGRWHAPEDACPVLVEVK